MQQISHEHLLYTGPYASPGYTTETHSPLEKQTHKHTGVKLATAGKGPEGSR